MVGFDWSSTAVGTDIGGRAVTRSVVTGIAACIAPDALDLRLLAPVVARAADVKSLQNRTVRVNMTNAQTMEKRKPVIDRFLAAYKETLDFMYSSPEAIAHFAEIADMSKAQALEGAFQQTQKYVAQAAARLGVKM